MEIYKLVCLVVVKKNVILEVKWIYEDDVYQCIQKKLCLIVIAFMCLTKNSMIFCVPNFFDI